MPFDKNWEVHSEGQWILGNHPDATDVQRQQLVHILQQYRAAFAYSPKEMTGYNGSIVDFQLYDENKRMWEPPRHFHGVELSIGDEKVGELLDADFIFEAPSNNPHAYNLTFPLKRDPNGAWLDRRTASDMRRSNTNVKPDCYRPPLPETVFARVAAAGTTVMSKLDCRQGFLNLKLSPKASSICTFHWRGKLYSYKRMPYGHINATAEFQKVMDKEIAAAGLSHTCAVFVDDILLFSPDMATHLRDLEILLKHLITTGIKLHPAKSILAADCVPYLGHLLDAKQLSPEPAKVQGMVDLPPPANVKQLQAQLGLFNFYRCYVPGFSIIAKPLYELLKKGQPFVWSYACQQAYDSIKQAFLKPGLALSLPDPEQTLHLYTDWSEFGIAAILNQRDLDGNERMIGCVSRTLNTAEQNYPAYKGECLAAVYGVKSFRPYLLGVHYYHHTDAKPLLWLLTAKDSLSSQAMRWALQLSEYRYTIVHRPGVHNIADAPSRQPGACAVDWCGARIDLPTDIAPLPAVIFSDGTPDTTAYSHEQLTAELGVKSSSKRGAAAASVPAAAIAAASLAAPTSVQWQHIVLANPSAMLLQAHAGQLSTAAVSSSIPVLQYQVLHCLLANNETAVDSLTADAVSLLGGGEGSTESFSATTWQPQQLQQLAADWVYHAAQQLATSASTEHFLSGSYGDPADGLGIRPTLQLNTTTVGAPFYSAAQQHGIVLYEPFGGICSGLEACLRNGITVKQYLYSDIDPAAQLVAAHRVQQLQQQYPLLLPASSLQEAFSLLPADVTTVSTQQLFQVAATQSGVPWLVVAGFPCQDFSLAGPSKGLAGVRSQLLYHLIRIIGALQQMLPTATAYLIENVAFQYHSDASISQHDYSAVCSMIGSPVALDAVQFGSLARRLRNYWTNLCSAQQLSAAACFVQRPPGRQVQQVLLPGRVPMPVIRHDRAPHFSVNQPGLYRAAWPTLMGRPGSYAFKPGQPGSLLDISNPQQPVWTEPSAVEREQAMGYAVNSTSAEGISDQQRCQLLGQAIDANTLQGILAISIAWWQYKQSAPLSSALGALQGAYHRCSQLQGSPQRTVPQSAAADAASTSATTGGTVPPSVSINSSSSSISSCLYSACVASSTMWHKSEYQATFTQLNAMAAAAEAADLPLQQPGSSGDIWTDHPAMEALQQGSIPSSLPLKERKRISKRIGQYSWIADQLYRQLSDGSTRLVPPPEQRTAIIQQCHDKFGHFGIRRTAAQLLLQYWWKGLIADTANCVSQCQHCSREQAAFVARPKQLQSIPISTAGFRWHVDLAEDLPPTVRGNQHVLVAIEAFTKFLIAVPLRDKKASTAAEAFKHRVLAVFAAPGMVVSDSGGAFGSEFTQMLADAKVEHSHTSAYHPQANGQAEKAVHIVKASLKRMVSAKHSVADWDLDIADLVVGYNCSPVASTKFAPYALMFAREPSIAPAIQQQLLQPIDYDDAAAAEADLLQRRKLIQRYMPAALENLAVAQHRDQLRYLKGKAAKEVTFAVGDFVYIKNNQVNSALQPVAKPYILRIKQIKPSGVCVLEGHCGSVTERSMDQLALCHLQLDPTIDPLIVDEVDDIVCEICGTDELESQLLLCELCNSGWHTFCLQPPLATVPDGYWVCPQCTAAGKTAEDAARAAQQREQLQQQQQLPNIFPDANMRRRDSAAELLHGRYITRTFKDPITKRPRSFWGKLYYRGKEYRPRYFWVVYEDGEQAEMSAAAAKRYIKPEGTQPPEGVIIPEPSALAAMQQQFIHCLSAAVSVPIAAAVVPLAAVELLVDFMDSSLLRPLHDPITCNASVATSLQQLGYQLCFSKPQTCHAGIIVAPAEDSLTACLSALQACRAAWLACYLPVRLQKQHKYLVQLIAAQRSNTLLQRKQHLWLIIG